MTQYKLRLKESADTSRWSVEFLDEVNKHGRIYEFLDKWDYFDYKNGKTFHIKRKIESPVSDYWSTSIVDAWELIPVVHLPPELFELD